MEDEIDDVQQSEVLTREHEVQRHFAQQQRDFDVAQLRDEQIARERKFHEERDAREALFAEREKRLSLRQRDFEQQLMTREREIEALRSHLSEEVTLREAKLQQDLIELQQEKDRYNEESRTRIQRTSKDYVSEALETLDRKEKQFHRISMIWNVVGAGALSAGLCFFAYVTISSLSTIPSSVTWEYIAFLVIKGLISVVLLATLARYAFLFSNSYMREALKNADRGHAINFGKFYLESYGAAAEWSQVKEAFEHWNITGSNAFSKEEVQIDLTAVEKAASLLEKVNKSLPKPKGQE